MSEAVGFNYKDVLMNEMHWPTKRFENVLIPDGILWDPKSLVVGYDRNSKNLQKASLEYRRLNRRRSTRFQPIDESPAQASTMEEGEIPSPTPQVGGDLVLELPMNEQIEAPPLEPQEEVQENQVEQEIRLAPHAASRSRRDDGWITPQDEPTWIDRANSTRFLRCRAKQNTSGRVMMFLNRALHNDQGQYKELSMHMSFEHDMQTFLENFQRGSRMCSLDLQEELVLKLDCISDMMKRDLADSGHPFNSRETAARVGRRRRAVEEAEDAPPRRRMRL